MPTWFNVIHSPSWYHGKISRVMADKRLRIFPSDCFLIRESENRIGSFSLSLKFAGIIKHFRIDRQQTSGRYCLYGAQRSFTSLTTLVDHHTQYCVSSSGGELLRTPCPSEVCTCMLESMLLALVQYSMDL